MAEGIQKTCKHCDEPTDWQQFNGFWSLRNKDGSKHFCKEGLEFMRAEHARLAQEAEENKRAIERYRDKTGYL